MGRVDVTRSGEEQGKSKSNVVPWWRVAEGWWVKDHKWWMV